jgi:hypothetical protein
MSRQQPKSISNNTNKNQKQVSSSYDGGAKSPKILQGNKKDKFEIPISYKLQINIPSSTYFERKLHDGIYSGVRPLFSHSEAKRWDS